MLWCRTLPRPAAATFASSWAGHVSAEGLGITTNQGAHMKIGIIGAGNIGGTLTRRLAALGHEVFVANSRGPEMLRELAAEPGATAVSVTEAACDKDVVVVTIPEKNIPDLPDDLFTGAGDVVVDTCNYYPQQRDGR